jgi:tripartite-type tricarboxylate transporter receptor subunit TctC
LPDVPTFAEAGYPQLNGSTWLGMLYPAGVPKPIVDKVSADINEILVNPEVTSTMRLMGIDAMVMKSDEFGEFLRSDITKWKQMISNANITVN